MGFKNYFLVILVSLIVLQGFIPKANGLGLGENDMTTVVNWVIDGDTFNVTSGDRIRLADIDAPELEENGYNDARDLLISFIYGKTIYLDIDDILRTDPYGRLICVAFVDYNSTHVKNINKALLIENVVIIQNFTNNEFNPNTWTLYVSKILVPEIKDIVLLKITLIIVSLTIVILKKKLLVVNQV